MPSPNTPGPDWWVVDSCEDVCDTFADLATLAQKFNDFINYLWDFVFVIPFCRYNPDLTPPRIQYAQIGGGDIFNATWLDVPKSACGDVYYENGKLMQNGNVLNVQTIQDVVTYSYNPSASTYIGANGNPIIPYQWAMRYNAVTFKDEYATTSGNWIEIDEPNGTVRAKSQTELEVKLNGVWVPYTL